MRVLYLSGVVPFEFNAGYTLMFRHLSRLRGHEVLIVTRDLLAARGRALPHRAVILPERSRLFHRVANRIGSPYFWLELEASRIRRLAQPHARAHRPDVVLTVWGTPYLLAAADLAQELGVPLALVCHDDFEQMLPGRRGRRRWAEKRLAPVYRSAAVSICAGPGVVEQLEKLYGKTTTEIVYPIPAEVPPFVARGRKRAPGDPLRIGFFGETGGNYKVLEAVADALPAANAEFHLFSHSTGAEREAIASRERVQDHGATDPQGLLEFFRAQIDLTLIPQGFEVEHLALRRACFPSKLPEACQIGLPLLVIGPREGSPGRWASENLEEPAYLDSLEPARLHAALSRLAAPAEWERQRERVGELARTMFSPNLLHGRFEKALHLAAGSGATMGARLAGVPGGSG